MQQRREEFVSTMGDDHTLTKFKDPDTVQLPLNPFIMHTRIITDYDVFFSRCVFPGLLEGMSDPLE